MSISAMTKVYESGLEKSMKAIALAYADHAHDDGSNIYPTIGYISWKTGYSRRAVQMITGKLVEAGVLAAEGDGPNGANRYHMRFDKLPERKPYRGAKSAPLGVQILHPPHALYAPLGVQEMHGGGAPVAPKPSFNHQSNHQLIEGGNDESVEIIWGMLVEFCEGEKDTAVKVWQLQVAYSEKSLIPRPDIDTKNGRRELADSWWPALRDVLNACGGDVERAIAGLVEGITSQGEWKADSISTPASVRRKTLAKIAALQRGAVNGHGQQLTYAAYTI